MRFSFFAVLFVIAVSCIAPSHQYGTMFADNITPAFNDETNFQGIKTFESFTTDASIGTIDAHNVAGFSINTPGSVTSTSNTLSMVASQGIEFGATDLSVNSAGSLSLTGQRIDFDSSIIDFSGSGDVIMGGIKSQVRAPTFTLDVNTDLHLSSSGSTLDISAPVGVHVNALGAANFNAGNNVELLSRSGEASFTGASVSGIANFIDFDGEIEFSATATNSLNLSAGAIAEFASAGTGTNTLDNMSVTVSSGDIVLDAAGIISISTDTAVDSLLSFSAIRNAFIVSRSAAESVIRIDATEDLNVSARESVIFGTFNQESDLTFSGQSSTFIAADSSSVTTTFGDLIARNDLSINALNDVSFSVTAQDITATSATGNIEFLATLGSFVLTTEDDFVTSSGDAFIDTQDDITVTGGDVSFRQNNIDANGALRIDTSSTLDIDTTFVEFDTSGTLDFTMSGDMTIDASNLSILGSKVASTVEFDTDETVTFSSENSVTYDSDLFTMNTNRYIANARDITIEVTDAYSFIVGDTTSIIAQEVDVLVRKGSATFTAGDSFTLNAETLNDVGSHREFNAGNEFNLDAEDFMTFTANSYFGAEVEGALSIFTPFDMDLSASRTIQFLQRTFEMTSDNVSFASDRAIYHAQNLPDDQFDLLNIATVAISGSTIGLVAGGDFSIDAETDLDLSGDTSFNVEALNALTMAANSFSVFANGFIGVHSGGELEFAIDDSFTAIIENSLIINGPEGEHGLVSFTSEFFDLQNLNLDMSGRSVTINTAAHTTNVIGSMDVGTNSGDLSIYAGDRFVMDGQIEVLASGPISIFGRDLVRMNTQSVINMFAATALEIRTRQFSMRNARQTIIQSSFADGRLTFEGDDLDVAAGSSFSMDAVDTSLYSGNTLDYRSIGLMIVESDAVTFEAIKSFTSNSQTLDLDSIGDSSFLSGGDMLFHFAGDFVNIVTGTVEFEASTFKTTTSLNNNWTASGDIEMNASDGVVSHFAENFGAYVAGGTIDYLSAGGIFHDTGALSFTGLGIDAITTQPNGNMIFDSTSGRVNMNAGGVHSLVTGSYANFFAFEEISYTSAAGVSILNGADFDFTSEGSTKGVIGGDMTFISGGSGHFEAGNRFDYEATLSFQVNSGCNLLVSTGEQGSLTMESSGGFNALAAISQTWVSSGNFDVNVDGAVTFTTLVGDISLFTTGGNIELSTDNDLDMTVGGNTSITSGDMISISSSLEQTWTSNTDSISSTAVQGDIIFDFDNEDAIFEAVNNILIQAKGAANPDNGVSISGADISFLANVDPIGTATFNPTNYLTIGDARLPDISYLAGGDPALAGITIDVAGDMITHAGSVSWDSSAVDGVFTTSVGGETHISADDTLEFIGTTGFSITAASDIFLSGDQTLNDSGTGFYSATATGGLFRFHTEEGSLVFDAQQALNIGAKNFLAEVGNFQADIDTQTDHTLSGGVTYSTTPEYGGSLSFSASFDDITLTSGGAFSMTTDGLDAPLTINVGTFNVETKNTGDVTMNSAGDLLVDSGTTMDFDSVNAISINANSNLGADLTDGTINISGIAGISANVRDSLSVSANRDVELIAELFVTIQARDVTFNSGDDHIIRVNDFFSNADALIFQNSVGGGGDVNFNANGLKDEIEFSVVNGITWNVGQNVVGYAFDTTTISADSENNQNEGLIIKTTAERGDLWFVSEIDEVNLVAAGAFNIDTNVGGPGVIDIQSEQTVSFIGDDGLFFVSQSGDIEISSLLGDISMIADGSTTFITTGTTGRIDIEANGISNDAESAISLFGDGNMVIGAPLADIHVDAWESIEFITSDFSNIIIGHVPDVAAGLFDITGTGTTSLLSSGPNADIIFNTLESQHGLGSVTILAGNKLPADSQIDMVTTENLRFVQESGITFAGFNEILDTDRPADVFFVAAGIGAAIEVSTSSAAMHSNIQVESSSILLDADNELVIRSGASRASSTTFHSEDKLTITVDSTDPNDHVVITGYEGNINILGRELVTMVAEGTEATLQGNHGVTMSGSLEVRIDVEGLVRFESDDGNLDVFTANDLFVDADFLRLSANNDINFDTNNVLLDTDTTQFITRTGNIIWNFGTVLDFSRSAFVEFETKNSLTIPMREESIVPGDSCFIEGEFMIAHNNFYYSYGMTPQAPIEEIKDTGIMLCYCSPGVSYALQYYCRPLAETFPV